MSNTFEDIATNYSETAAWRLPDPQLDSVTRLDAILRSSLSTDADHRSALERCRTESLNAARKLLSNPFLLPYEVASIKHSASACSAASSVDDGYTKLNRLASAMIWPQTASIYHADWCKMIGAGKSDDGADPSCVTKSDFDRAALTVLPYLRSSLQPIRNKAAANDDSYGDYDETIPEEFDYPYHAAMLGMILANENVVCAKSAFERQVLREMEAIYAACINEETATVNQSRLMSDLEDLATAYHGDGSTEPGPAFALIRSTPNDVEIMRADSPERARRGPPPGMLAMLRKAWISRIAKNNRGN